LDATYATGSQLSGVGVYCREILFHLADQHPEHRFLHCYRPHRLWRGLQETRASNCGIRPLWENRQWFQTKLFHGLNQRLPASKFSKSIVTFHDLFVMTSAYSTPGFRARFTRLAREAAERADLVLCVSRFTANQVRDLLGVAESRLRVVHHGVRFAASVNGPREPVVLHVGALQKRKNLAMLVRAFSRAAPAPWRLVLAGGDGYGAEEIHREIEASPAGDRIERTGWIADAELADWYRRAGVLAFPSLDEGFGIPAVEAMACGLPVVCSDRGSLPEVCGNGAWIVTAEDQEAWEQALVQLTSDEALRVEWGHKGRSQKVITWAEAARQTWSVYQELEPGLDGPASDLLPRRS
jgi:glycosyltransferase involved in cell wall biosynthesis